MEFFIARVICVCVLWLTTSRNCINGWQKCVRPLYYKLHKFKSTDATRIIYHSTWECAHMYNNCINCGAANLACTEFAMKLFIVDASSPLLNIKLSWNTPVNILIYPTRARAYLCKYLSLSLSHKILLKFLLHRVCLHESCSLYMFK